MSTTYQNNLLLYEALEMIILHSNMFYSWEELLRLRDRNTIFISLNTLQKTYGYWICITKINYNSFINDIQGINFRITWLNAIYSASVVLKVIRVCNLLHHNTVHSTYVITYPVRHIRFSALSACTWAHPLENSAST